MLIARRRCRCLATTALVVVALAPASPAQEARFGEQVRVVEIEVPVQVLRDGEAVRGLTRDDFEILEGRKKREIVGFEVVDLSLTEGAAAGAIAALPVAARRHFLLLFDLSFSSPSSIVRARDAATEFVRTGLHPTDLVAVATVSAAEGVRMPLGFTSDRQQIEYAIATLGLPQLVESVKDPLGFVLADRQFFSQVASGPRGGSVGRTGIDVRAEVEEHLEGVEATVRVATDRDRILNLTVQLANLAGALRNVEGRKHVLFLSEGFDSSVIMGVGRGITEDEQATIQAQAESAMRGEVWNVDSNQRFGETSSQNQLTGMLHEFVKSGCTIQAIDTAGLEGADAIEREAYGEDGLFVMAEETGGEFLRNYNNLTTALGEVLERTSVTYLLTFRPGDLENDGEYHEIKVRLTDGDRGVRLVSRPGYYAPLPFASQGPIERRLSTAELILGGQPGGDIAATLLTAAFPMASGTSYVPALLEVGGASLLAGFKGARLPAEIYGYAIAADGTVADYFTQLMEFDLAQHGAALRQSGLKFWGHLELAPGSYSVRVLVRNSATGASSLQVASVEVPAAGVAQLLPPLVPEPPGKWLLGRQQGADVAQYPYPFLIDGQPMIPAARPLLGRNSQTRVALAGYHLGGETLAARAELRGLDGAPVEGVELALEQRTAGEAPGFERLVASLTVGAVPAGHYDLVVSVRDEASGATRSSTLPVEIGG
jgi:VWFA-related protein